jgi:hypothetical protein
MNPIMKCARLLALLIIGLWLVPPVLADDGDGSNLCQPVGFEGFLFCLPKRDWFADHSRPGSVIVFPLFRRSGDSLECGAGNVLVNGMCLPRTEIELGATCPTRFTYGDQSQEVFPCIDDEPVRARFRWVCPGTEQEPTCKATGFDALLSLNGKVVFTANGFSLPDANQVRVPVAPCDKGYLIGWVIDASGQPIKYDGLIGKAVIQNSGTAAAAYRGITIQANAETRPGDPIELVPDPLGLKPAGLPFFGIINVAPPGFVASPSPYRLVTGQVTGDVTFDAPQPGTGPGFGVSSSLILLTLDVRANNPNYPTFVGLEFWNGFEERLSTSVEFVCWGEFQLSTDIDGNLTQEFMGTQKGIVQSGEAFKTKGSRNSDIAGNTTLLGLAQINEIPAGSPVARSYMYEFYDNGISIHYHPTVFFP